MKEVRAKKFLGQHFLKDKSIAKKIVNLLNKENNTTLEIGPGMGVLTEFLIQQKKDLEVIEIDSESVDYLIKRYPFLKKKIRNYDFLKLDIKKNYQKKISIIGNFPYNISSQILFKILENRNQIYEIVGMLQKEVADRICSEQGKKKGILSVLIQTFYTTEYCFTVESNVFHPVPKVRSGVIKLTRNKRGEVDCSYEMYVRVIKACFNQRRKTLRNALKVFNLPNTEEISVYLKLRAEQLSCEDFIKITLHVEKNYNK